QRNWGDFQTAINEYKAKATASGGAGLRFLSETVMSPTLAWQLQTVLKKFPGARCHQWDGVNRDSARAASQTLFGQYAEPIYRFDAAKVVLSLDADFLSGSHFPGFLQFVGDMNAGKVDMLVILEAYPVYTAPVDLDVEGAMSKVANNVHLSCYRNETPRVSQWHIHGSHRLESWGDARAYDGTSSL